METGKEETFEQVLALKHLKQLESGHQKPSLGHDIGAATGGERHPPTTQTELNDKYKELIAKINRQTHNDEDAGLGDAGESNASINDEEESSNSNDQLKKLYDASVAFKNDLANLRGSIKALNAKT